MNRHPTPSALLNAITWAILEHNKKCAERHPDSIAAQYSSQFPSDAVSVIEQAVFASCERHDEAVKEVAVYE